MKKHAAEIIREEFDIPGCRSVIRLDKEPRRQGELVSYDTRYLVSSLDSDVVSAAEFQELILRHWEIENCLHLQKDRYFEEDKHCFSSSGFRRSVDGVDEFGGIADAIVAW